MIRKIIQINQEKCNGCGLCVDACHEGAIGLLDGKAKLLRDDYCDGLGDCLPACPTNAITFVEREAAAYDEAAVLAEATVPTELKQWPVQIKLAPVNAPYFNGADLLIAADCTAYAYGDFHRTFMRGKVVLVGCPKLDEGDYTEKLSALIAANDLKSVTVVRMEVPCCGGIERAVVHAVEASGKTLPCEVVTLSLDGQILNR